MRAPPRQTSSWSTLVRCGPDLCATTVACCCLFAQKASSAFPAESVLCACLEAHALRQHYAQDIALLSCVSHARPLSRQASC